MSSLFKNSNKHRGSPKSLENAGHVEASKKESLHKSKSLDRIKKLDVSGAISGGKSKAEKSSNKGESSPKVTKAVKKVNKRSLSDTGKLKVIHQNETASSPETYPLDSSKPRPKSECSSSADKIVPPATHHRKLSGASAKELQAQITKKQQATPISVSTTVAPPIQSRAKSEGSLKTASKTKIHPSKQASLDSYSSPTSSLHGDDVTLAPLVRQRSSQSQNSPAPKSPKSPHSTLTKSNIVAVKSRLPVPVSNLSGSKPTSATAKTEKALKARLYLLQRMGPANFIVTGDNTENKYRVNVGPQTCACGKTSCIHLLFVMLRVLKVPQDSPLLWAKELKNFEVETLLNKYDSRVNRQTSIGKQRKRLSKGDNVMSSSSSFHSSMSSDLTEALLSIEEPKGTELSKSPATEDDLDVSSIGSEVEDTTTDQELIEEDLDDVLCPICLLELVEGEDVVMCVSCENEMHQHCMDIWGQELKRREEKAWCPLCRSVWEQGGETASSMQVSIKPQNKDGLNSGFRPRTKSDAARITLRDAKLDKEILVAVLMEHLPKSSSEHLFAPSWRTRETSILRLRKSLLSALTSKSGLLKRLSDPSCESIVGACCGVAAICCCDPVLKVYLASVELLRTVFACCVCSTEKEQTWLRMKMKPAISVLLTRCFDAQSRVKECSLQLLLDVCLGPDGPLSAQPSYYAVGGMSYTFSILCEDPAHTLRKISQWWMGRLVVLDHLMSKFELHATSPDDSVPLSSKSQPVERSSLLIYKIFQRSESSSSCDSSGSSETKGSIMWPTSSNDFLLMAITFASKSTHVQNYKVYRLAKRIIIKAVKYLYLNQDVFLSVLESVARCSGSVKNQWLRKVCKMMMERRLDLRLTPGIMEAFGNFDDIERLHSRRRAFNEESKQVESLNKGTMSNSDIEYVEMESASDTDFKSEKKVSSRCSEPYYSVGSPLSKDSSVTSGEQKVVQAIVEEAKITEQPTKTSTPIKKPPLQHQESVAETDEQVIGQMLLCRKSVEQEEEEAFAKMMSQLPHEDPLPPLSGIEPPGVEAIVYIQSGPLADQQDGEAVNVKEYVEGAHWTKGRVIGTGAYCTCFLARDVKSGTIMAVKQVSYCRNTSNEEEKELKRLKEEVAMLGRLRHPNIVRCLGATQVPGHFNIFVEWMAGGSVDKLICDFGSFDEAVIIKYLKQIMFGVGYLHEHRAIHRDIKGANILVDSTGQRVRVADFGAAARLAAQVTGDGEFRNDMQGTVAFMAPEVVRGEHYGRRCDVWSIGCVVIQMATGSPPWGAKEATNSYALIYKIASTKEPPYVPEFSNPALRDVTLQCLEVTPRERPHIADLLRHSLWQI